jgi:hypothetical protein
VRFELLYSTDNVAQICNLRYEPPETFRPSGYLSHVHLTLGKAGRNLLKNPQVNT